ncbi:hypothetical protein EV363DRAFT_1183722 [Boletus edulis]|uniref:DUF6532 domain-containing protein n=2 Tax=Boletus edulis BED1 TaxID=1328754 RepID=A0AAD4B9B9_BOLED|nr:hypothetical protein EV363DRAFT_1183722 [Boletus edulis]KAF8414551.1 hypothetical protein L210DRAFT_3658942 [Boletus edulis BED1]
MKTYLGIQGYSKAFVKFSCLDEHVRLGQTLWNRFIKIEHTLSLKDEPVFAILKQRTSEWRSEIAKKALVAVNCFFTQYEELTTPEGCALYVAWAAPQNKFDTDKNGRRIIIPPKVYPYMWKEAIETAPGSFETKGAFRHPCIIETFAYFMETISQVPKEVQEKQGYFPIAALALCTAAVERAFKFYKTGKLVIPHKRSARKFSKHLWGFATGEIIRATRKLSPKQWGKLKELTMEYTEGIMGQSEEFMCEKAGVRTGRALCIEEDSD